MIAFQIKRLLQFAQKHRIIEKSDTIQMQNLLMDLLNISQPHYGETPNEELETASEIIEEILNYCVEKNIIGDTLTERDLFEAKIMGILMPRQSEAIRTFKSDYNISPKTATDNFYTISQKCRYIQVDRINKNLYWQAPCEYGDIEITVNLSKPEKDPKEIAAAKNQPQTNYPKCLLCAENVGFAGTLTHPARQNHRIIPVTLSGENWYFQYSPYVYYNEHCIVLNEKHTPMKISRVTFERLFEFVSKFPHYFIGSNADLPIVGGSILTHDHFQGGRHIFPMEVAPKEEQFTFKDYDAEIGIVKWPMSTIRITGKDYNDLIEIAMHIFESWKEYSDKEAKIQSHTDTECEKIRHNTVTPIVRRKYELYEIDIVLRNNRTSEEHPLGIFHPHAEVHHIKKENIGLIEVMGLAVLPGRLNDELGMIRNILTGSDSDLLKDIEDTNSPLHKHKEWITSIANKSGRNLSENESDKILKQAVGKKFLQVLLDAGVYKRNPEGKKQFTKFLEGHGFIMKQV